MKKILGILFCAATISLDAITYETMKMDSVRYHLSPDVLVIFDIDNTIMEPIQELGSDQWFCHRIKHYKETENLDSAAATQKTLLEWTAVQNITDNRLVEPETKTLIEELQAQGVSVMGLTTRGLALSYRTVEELESIGIDLSPTAPTKDEIFLNNIRSVLFRKGILFTDATHKGKALIKFLDLVGYPLKSVIFVNDKASHIREIEEVCEDLGIPFIGLRYGATDARVKAFRPDIADVQFQHFGKILSDDEAEKLIQTKS